LLRSFRTMPSSRTQPNAPLRHTAFSGYLRPYRGQVRFDVTTPWARLNGCDPRLVNAYHSRPCNSRTSLARTPFAYSRSGGALDVARSEPAQPPKPLHFHPPRWLPGKGNPKAKRRTAGPVDPVVRVGSAGAHRPPNRRRRTDARTLHQRGSLPG